MNIWYIVSYHPENVDVHWLNDKTKSNFKNKYVYIQFVRILHSSERKNVILVEDMYT